MMDQNLIRLRIELVFCSFLAAFLLKIAPKVCVFAPRRGTSIVGDAFFCSAAC